MAQLVNGFPFDSALFDLIEGTPLVRIRDLFARETEVKWPGEFVPPAEIGDGDILIGMDGDFNVAWWNQGRALLNQRVCCVRARIVEFDQRYLYHCLTFPLKELNDVTHSTTVKHLSSVDVLKFRLPFPPLPEQRAIARYLDYMDRRIQRYIRAKERLIELLEEQKRAVINHAVTRGLDPDVPLKPSGVEWFADVPAHWEVRRLKFLYKQVDERSKTGDEELMSVSHITGVTPRKKNVNMFLAETNLGYKLCNPGDVVINTMWAFMAALGVARQIGLVSPSYAVYRPIVRGNLCDDYVEALLRIEAYKANYFIRSTGITSSRLRLYPDSFLDIPLINPPVEEQSSIAEYVGRATADTDSAIDRVRRQMELMSEYRTRLILDVVTGKLDVRDAVANLPDDLGDDELWEPSGDL